MKISNFRQLKKAQKQLQQRQTDLESAIRKDWKEVKHSVQPGNLINNTATQWIFRQLVKIVIKKVLH